MSMHPFPAPLIEQTVRLEAVTDLAATPVGAGAVELTWTDGSRGETGWEVYAQDYSGTPLDDPADVPANLLVTISGSASSYTWSSAPAGTVYRYQVVPLHYAVAGGASNIASATALAGDVEVSTSEAAALSESLARTTESRDVTKALSESLGAEDDGGSQLEMDGRTQSDAAALSEALARTTESREVTKALSESLTAAESATREELSAELSGTSESAGLSESLGRTTESRDVAKPLSESLGAEDGSSTQEELGLGVSGSDAAALSETHARTVDQVAPATPTVTGWSQGSGSIDLTWNPVSGATAYDVQVLRDGQSIPTTYSGVTSPFAFEDGLGFVQYQARVRARNSAGSSAYSAYTSLVSFPF